MQSIRVAAVSMNGRLGEPERVLGEIAAWCERAAAERADLVLFPELVVHGHCTPNTWELAEPVPEGPSVQRLIELARRHGWFCAPGSARRSATSSTTPRCWSVRMATSASSGSCTCRATR